MPDGPRVERLRDEQLASDATPEEDGEQLASDATPEEDGGDGADLSAVDGDRWRQVCRVRAELDAMFPPAAEPGESLPALPSGGTPLPVVPGYEVEAVLGLGGMGVVFRARHIRLNRVVALKMPLAGGYAGPGERDCLQREAEAVAALRHPNVVPVYDIGESDGRPYFTMEYVAGGSLAQELAGTPRPARDAAALLGTVAGAVQAAHEAGVVHRDLKPANVLLTPDGVPKVSDFGLARRLGGEAGPTRTGVAAGTPSYMAPEQARGRAGEVGPAADIYALGAILYELLTGRPPFRAETGPETVLQVISQPPVPPSRLNGTVPRDLETVCLKCLEKDPLRRYATAAALADDLARFRRGEPVVARPVGRPERLVRLARRNPTATALVITASLLTAVAVGTGLRERDLAAQRRAEAARWAERLGFVDRLQRDGRFAEARATLQDAPGGDPGVAERVAEARARLDLVERLDAIRLTRGRDGRGNGLDYPQSCRRYSEAFRVTGLGAVGDAPDEVARRLAPSPVRKALVAALDDWAACAEKGERDWVLGVSSRLDPDPWRDRVRDPAAWARTDAFPALAAAADVPGQPATLMVAFGTRWRRLGGDPRAFLEKVQREHPTDFWVNFELGHLLYQRDPAAAVGYFRAALAVRPDAAVVHTNLSFLFAAAGRGDDVVHHAERSIEADPGQPSVHEVLARALADRGRLGEGVDHWRRALALDPKLTHIWRDIRSAQLKLGRAEEACDEWRRFLADGGGAHDNRDGYAELCLFLGRHDEYRRACGVLLDRFGASADAYVAERTGRACLLAPLPAAETARAAALIDRALADKTTSLGWARPFFLFAKGLAEYRGGRWERARAILVGEASGGLRPAPQLVLAMTQCRLGQVDAARATLAEAILAFDWRAANADTREAWIMHVLRREAEHLILPNLPAFLKCDHVPRDNDERLPLIRVCRFTNRTLAVARLYAGESEARRGVLARGYSVFNKGQVDGFILPGGGVGGPAGQPVGRIDDRGGRRVAAARTGPGVPVRHPAAAAGGGAPKPDLARGARPGVPPAGRRPHRLRRRGRAAVDADRRVGGERAGRAPGRPRLRPEGRHEPVLRLAARPQP